MTNHMRAPLMIQASNAGWASQDNWPEVWRHLRQVHLRKDLFDRLVLEPQDLKPISVLSSWYRRIDEQLAATRC